MTKTAEQIRCFANNVVEVPKWLRIADLPDTAEQSKAFREEYLGTFRILTPEDGDKRVIWNRRIMEEIKAAKQMFLDLISSGMQPFRVGIDGQATSEVMTEFDPLAEEVIFVPIRAIAGG